ncbi:UNVERIFIED_CONTAM: hypothetical protein FKN15_043813 [Acipenser sinensis]
MADRRCSDESEHCVDGLRFVQLQKDSVNQNLIKRSPYQAMFGTRARVGLADAEILDSLASRKTWKMSFHLPLGTREFELEGVLFYFILLFPFKNNRASSFLVCNLLFLTSCGQNCICAVQEQEEEEFGSQVLCDRCSKKQVCRVIEVEVTHEMSWLWSYRKKTDFTVLGQLREN